ncbi:MAG: hypothetical protein ACN4GK_12015 [Acidimicrobiia bacterium]
MKPTRPVVEALDSVIETARSVLRDFEPEQVPATLMKVAKHSGKRLPPPYARSLVSELHENDWLRDKVTDALIEADPASDDTRLAAAGLFLHRPDDWESRFSQIVADREDSQAGSQAANLEQTIEKLKSSLDAAKAKERKARQALAETQSDADKRVKEAKALAEAARMEAAAPSAGLEKSLDEADAEINRLRTSLIEADGRIDSLKHMLLKARRMERDDSDGTTPSIWQTGDTLEMAKMLDDVMVAMRPRSTSRDAATGTAEALVVPDGIRPDQADAINWMLQQERPVTLVVDGYNVAYQLDESRYSTPELREQVRDGLSRLRRLAKGPLPVVLVFDSKEDVAKIPGQVETRFVPVADDEVVRLAAELSGDVIVISTDREVRERAEYNGAIALWSDALVAWMRGR